MLVPGRDRAGDGIGADRELSKLKSLNNFRLKGEDGREGGG